LPHATTNSLMISNKYHCQRSKS